MGLKPEQISEIKDAVEDALNNMLPQFIGSDPISMLTTAMEASIGHVDFSDGRTAKIVIVVEIETGEGD